MRNSEAKRGTLVMVDGEPHVVVRLDSAEGIRQMALVAPGDVVPTHNLSKVAHWTFVSRMEPRELAGDATPEAVDATLEIVVATIREQADYHRAMSGEDGIRFQTILNLGYDLATALHSAEPDDPDRRGLIFRMFGRTFGS